MVFSCLFSWLCYATLRTLVFVAVQNDEVIGRAVNDAVGESANNCKKDFHFYEIQKNVPETFLR